MNLTQEIIKAKCIFFTYRAKIADFSEICFKLHRFAEIRFVNRNQTGRLKCASTGATYQRIDSEICFAHQLTQFINISRLTLCKIQKNLSSLRCYFFFLGIVLRVCLYIAMSKKNTFFPDQVVANKCPQLWTFHFFSIDRNGRFSYSTRHNDSIFANGMQVLALALFSQCLL